MPRDFDIGRGADRNGEAEPSLLGELKPQTREFLRRLQGADDRSRQLNLSLASLGTRLELLTHGLSVAEKRPYGEVHVLTPLGRAAVAALPPLSEAEVEQLLRNGAEARARL